MVAPGPDTANLLAMGAKTRISDTASLPLLLCDWELWACARQQIVRYGDDAAVHAAMRSDALLAANDLAGHRTWLAILARIGELSGVGDHETRH